MFDEELIYQHKIHHFCRKAKIKYQRGGEFVVITTRIILGFNISKDSSEFISFDSEKNAVKIQLPNVEIVDVLFEDYAEAKYTYPDIGITPAEYREVIGVVEEKIELLIKNLGYKEVVFLEE